MKSVVTIDAYRTYKAGDEVLLDGEIVTIKDVSGSMLTISISTPATWGQVFGATALVIAEIAAIAYLIFESLP